MKTRKKFYIFLLVVLVLCSLSFARKSPPVCPALLAGRVEITVDPNTGAGAEYAEFNCQFLAPPVVVVTPNYDAQFFVDRVFVVVPDDGLGAGVNVLTDPGQALTLTVNWVATVANVTTPGAVKP